MMTLDFSPAAVTFRCGARISGVYRFSDAFKPHIHPLCTPLGHCVTACSPHDHRHHKALMYALRAEDVNFWEEVATRAGEVPGVERHVSFEKVVGIGIEVGFEETLRWCAEDGTLPSFDEVREIRCTHRPEQRGFVWTWCTRLTALRNIRLVQSQWSHALDDGSLVNYHGLGVRLRRDFGGMTRNHSLCVDGERITEKFQSRMGWCPAEVRFRGSIDGTWPVERAEVAFSQPEGQRNALYVMEDYIPFMALGPTNSGPLEISAGQCLIESYQISVLDVQ